MNETRNKNYMYFLFQWDIQNEQIHKNKVDWWPQSLSSSLSQLMATPNTQYLLGVMRVENLQSFSEPFKSVFVIPFQPFPNS